MVTSQALRIVYFGTPAFAVPTLQRLLASRHAVALVVSQPDRPKGRGQHFVHTATKEVALAHGVPVLQPEHLRDEAFLRAVGDLRPDLGVVAAYGRLLPDALLAIPRLGMINVHGSILPRWRGAAPVHRAIIAGDTETGVTIMRVVKELDAGAVFATVPRTIGPNETSVEVERDLAELGAGLLADTVEALADGRAVETPQPPEGVTYAAKLTKANHFALAALGVEPLSPQPSDERRSYGAGMTTTTWLLFFLAIASQAAAIFSAVARLMDTWSCSRSAALPESTNCCGTWPLPS